MHPSFTIYIKWNKYFDGIEYNRVSNIHFRVLIQNDSYTHLEDIYEKITWLYYGMSFDILFSDDMYSRNQFSRSSWGTRQFCQCSLYLEKKNFACININQIILYNYSCTPNIKNEWRRSSNSLMRVSRWVKYRRRPVTCDLFALFGIQE